MNTYFWSLLKLCNFNHESSRNSKKNTNYYLLYFLMIQTFTGVSAYATDDKPGIETIYLNQNTDEPIIFVNDPLRQDRKPLNRLTTSFVGMGLPNIMENPRWHSFPGFGVTPATWDTTSRAGTNSSKITYGLMNSMNTPGNSKLVTLNLLNVFNWLPPGEVNATKNPLFIFRQQNDNGFFLIQSDINIPFMQVADNGNTQLEFWLTFKHLQPDGQPIITKDQTQMSISVPIQHTAPEDRVFRDYLMETRDVTPFRFYVSHALPQTSTEKRNINLHAYSSRMTRSTTFGWQTFSYTVSIEQLKSVLQKHLTFKSPNGRNMSFQSEIDLRNFVLAQTSLYMETSKTKNPSDAKAIMSVATKNTRIAYIPSSWIPTYKGYFDGFTNPNKKNEVGGWACAKDIGLPVKVEILAHNPRTSISEIVGATLANAPSNGLDKSDLCNTSTPHKFYFSLNEDKMARYKNWILSARLQKINPSQYLNSVSDDTFSLFNWKKGKFIVP